MIADDPEESPGWLKALISTHYAWTVAVVVAFGAIIVIIFGLPSTPDSPSTPVPRTTVSPVPLPPTPKPSYPMPTNLIVAEVVAWLLFLIAGGLLTVGNFSPLSHGDVKVMARWRTRILIYFTVLAQLAVCATLIIAAVVEKQFPIGALAAVHAIAFVVLGIVSIVIITQ